ncbi:winged helix-turn-helix transcriptional regulator [Candidatus Micrarchaeota archaeon]|nr:winged helix-turn-helix transcriptional regulator [Candidatus Micrarchaeota archaeon]
MFSIFARPKPCKIITLLRDGEWHLSKLAKNSDTTYVYVTKLIARLAVAGYVTIEPRGKKRMVKLTEKGVLVASTISELMTRLQ